MDELEKILLIEIDRFLDDSRMLPIGVNLSEDILNRFKRNLANHLSVTTFWYFREVRLGGNIKEQGKEQEAL